MVQIKSLAWAIALALGTLSVNSIAAEQDSESKQQNKIVITGSHIKRIDNESSSPLQVISSVEIERSGATSLAELLQSSTLSNGGSLNNQQTGGFTPGAASYNLRGLRADRTLVLVDGHRMASYPFGQNGNEAFVDLNSIPLMEIETIEILKDGASAVYGSDAISGVVNIITKRRIKEDSLTLKAQSSSGNFGGYLASYAAGFNSEVGDLVVVAEWQDFDALMSEDLGVDRLKDTEGSIYSFPGSYLTWDVNNNPILSPADGCEHVVDAANRSELNGINGSVCINDWAADRQLIPENSRASLSLKWSQFVGESTFYAEMAFNRIETTSDVNFGMFSNQFYFDATDPFNPLGEDLYFLRGMNDVGLQEIETEAKNTRAVLGLEGFISHFDYTLVLSHNRSRVDENYSKGWWHQDAWAAFRDQVEAREINPFVALTPAQFAGFTQVFNHRGETDQTTLAFNLSGEIGEFDAGNAYLATGVEFRTESLLDTSDQAILDKKVVGLGLSFAEGDRDVSAAFAELVIPAAEGLELNLALRFDDYSDFGSSFNPKVSASYKPNDSLLLRTSYGTGFRAPNLFELNGEVHGTQFGVPFVSLANPELDAETSESFNFGLVYDFNDQLTTSIDFWQINVEDMITQLGTDTIANTLDEQGNLVYSDLVIYDDNGEFLHVLNPYINLDRQDTEGIDLGFNYSVNEYFSVNINATHLSKLERFSTNGNGNDVAGHYLFPKKRVNTDLIFQMGAFSHVVSINHVGKHGEDQLVSATDSYQTYTYQLKYQRDEYNLLLTLDNLSDEKPPMDMDSTWPYYDNRLYSALGRNYSLALQYKL